jgi:hypothetical protein
VREDQAWRFTSVMVASQASDIGYEGSSASKSRRTRCSPEAPVKPVHVSMLEVALPRGSIHHGSCALPKAYSPRFGGTKTASSRRMDHATGAPGSPPPA